MAPSRPAPRAAAPRHGCPPAARLARLPPDIMQGQPGRLMPGKDPHDVRFELPDPALRAFRWEHNEHIHGSLTPLAQDASQRQSSRAGLARDGLPSTVFINGYSYSRPFSGLGASMPEHAQQVFSWRERWLPEVAETARELESFDPASVAPGAWDETIAAQGRRFQQSFAGIHRDTIVIVLPAAQLFIDRYSEIFGEGRRGDAAATLQGYANESSARSGALWALSRIARPDQDVRLDVEAGRVPEGNSAIAGEFRETFAGLLERWGHMTNMHLEDLPTWAEDHSRPLGMVAAYLDEPDDTGPLQLEQAQVERRKQLEAEIRSLAEHNERVRDLLGVLEIARHLVPASEDHNSLGDHRLLAASRVRWLRVGDFLKSRGLLGDASDVFYYRLDALTALLEGEAKPLAEDEVARLRADQARWRTAVPPGHLGGDEAESLAEGSLSGIAASGGTYRGIARVVASLDEAARLQRGDVLVCSATAPEWSAYFGLIGAVVTDMGGLLTHGAIVAREFGIPAVVGTGDATTHIADGAMVLVDGSAGVVTIEGGPAGWFE